MAIKLVLTENSNCFIWPDKEFLFVLGLYMRLYSYAVFQPTSSDAVPFADITIAFRDRWYTMVVHNFQDQNALPSRYENLRS